jgi:hypothetical protein
MPTSALILSAAILIGVFTSDLGRRKIGIHRVLRPLLIGGSAGALYLTGFATGGSGLAIELAGIGAGAALGLLVARLMRVESDPGSGEKVSQAGAGYALLWIAVVGARLAFIYGSQHWFSAELGSWMLAHHVTADALTDALVLMALAMTSTRTLSLLIRSRARTSGRLADVRVADARM